MNVTKLEYQTKKATKLLDHNVMISFVYFYSQHLATMTNDVRYTESWSEQKCSYNVCLHLSTPNLISFIKQDLRYIP